MFDNVNKLLMAFDIYRRARHQEPCVIWLSLPPNSTSTLPSELAQFSNSVSDCYTFGPLSGDVNPNLINESLNGMIPDAVVFHMRRNDKAALQLFDQLGSLFKVKISYDPLQIHRHTTAYLLKWQVRNTSFGCNLEQTLSGTPKEDDNGRVAYPVRPKTELFVVPTS